MTVRGPFPWDDDVGVGLAETFPSHDLMLFMREKVQSGNAQVWRIGESWSITEVFPNLLWIWCHQGKDAVGAAREFARIAADNGLSRVGLFTFHYRAVRRHFRRWPHTCVETETPGEYRIEFDSKELGYGSPSCDTKQHDDGADDQRAQSDDARDIGAGQDSGRFQSGPLDTDWKAACGFPTEY